MVKKRGPVCARCGGQIPYGQAVVADVRGTLSWVHKNAQECGA